MSPLIERGGRFWLDKIEKTKLYLMWLSCKDLSMLSETKNLILLKEVWKNIKSQLRHYFKDYAISLQSIIDTFKKINLTIDPSLSCGYDPEKDVLIFNLWALFFSLTSDNFATPAPTFKTAGELIHEFDHYSFCKQYGMIGKTEKEYEEFNKSYFRQLEKSAFTNQKAFLENCKNNVPSKTLFYKLKIRKWSSSGKPIGIEAPVIQLPKEAVMNSIDQMICEISDVVSKIETGVRYDVISTENSTEISLKLVDVLSLPIKFDAKKKDYPKIEIET